MAGSTPLLYRTFTWILLACLIGLYVLYDWYTDTLKQDLENQGAKATLSTQRLKDADTRLKRAAETEQDLKGQLAGLEARLASETQALTGKISDAKAELEALAERHRQATEQVTAHAAEIEGHKKALAEAADREQGLSAKLDAAAAAHAELEGAHQAARERVASLEGELERLNRTLAQNEARALQKAKELEQRLVARAEHFRTALEGSEPERARMLSEMERKTEEHRAARAKAEDALAGAHAETEQAKSEGEQVLAALRAESEQTLSATKSEAQRVLTETRSMLEGRLAEARKAADEGEAALKTATETHAREQKAAQAKIESLTTELESERSALSALQEKYDGTVAGLQTELNMAEQALTGAKSELGMAVRTAAEKQKSLEDQIAAAQGRIGALEQDLAQTRRQAEETHAADMQARQQAVAQARGLFARYSELGGKQTERGMLLSLSSDELRFASGAAVIPKGDHPGLDRIATLMKDQPKLTARIEGHTDNAGPDEINLKLSEARAEAVKQALIELGVPVDRLTSQGLGETKPIADNRSPAGRGRNRRVEVYVIEETQ